MIELKVGAIMFKGLNIINFGEEFSTDEKCYAYLAAIKWENGYSCAKCGNQKYPPTIYQNLKMA